jgi:hypothetical protein
MLHHMFSTARRFLHYAHQDPCGTPNEIIPSVYLRARKNSKPPPPKRKLEKFPKTLQPFQFLLTWDDYRKDVPHKKKVLTCA